MADQVQVPPGGVCMTTYGMIRHEAMSSLMEARSLCERSGLQNVRWYTMSGTLVEKTRNEACRMTLQDPNCGWLLFIDADMVFAPDLVVRLVQAAYGELPHADVLGGYCNLRGDLAIPTIDTGTGTWESWYPRSGPVEVMRTGAACLLVKRHVLQAMGDPWFRMRVPARPVDFMAEVDNFARIKFDGKNPFRELPEREWERLEQCAVDDPSAAGMFTPVEVGEDSGFCDRAKASGFRIFVHTDIVTSHVDTRIIDAAQHKKAMDGLALQTRQTMGITR